MTRKTMGALLRRTKTSLSLARPILRTFNTCSNVLNVLYCNACQNVARGVGRTTKATFTRRVMRETFIRTLPLKIAMPAYPSLRNILATLGSHNLGLTVIADSGTRKTTTYLRTLNIDNILSGICIIRKSYPPGPSPCCVHHFYASFSLVPSRIVVMNSALASVRFTRHNNMTTINITGATTYQRLLRPQTSIVVPSMSCLPTLLSATCTGWKEASSVHGAALYCVRGSHKRALLLRHVGGRGSLGHSG